MKWWNLWFIASLIWVVVNVLISILHGVGPGYGYRISCILSTINIIICVLQGVKHERTTE